MIAKRQETEEEVELTKLMLDRYRGLDLGETIIAQQYDKIEGAKTIREFIERFKNLPPIDLQKIRESPKQCHKVQITYIKSNEKDQSNNNNK